MPRHRASILAVTVFLLLAELCAAQAIEPSLVADRSASSTSRQSASAATSTAAVADRSQGPSHTSRIASNFLTLMGNSWGDAAWFAGRCVMNALLWAGAMLLVGMALGVTVFFVLRKYRLFHAPWGWYRYVRWTWGVLFISSIVVGMAGAGAWLGLERQLKYSILTERVLDRIVGNMILAVFMDSAQYQATGSESSEQLQAILGDSETVAQAATQDMSEALRGVSGRQLSPIQRYALQLLGTGQGQRTLTESLKLNPRMAIALFYGGPNMDRYLKEHPQANPGVMAMSVHFQDLRLGGCRLAESFTRPSLWSWLAAGCGLPFVLLLLFRMTVRFSRHAPQ